MPVPDSFIKNVAIEIDEDYLLSNTPLSINESSDSQTFIGRQKHFEKFRKFLDDSKLGIFLVTGERGIGKTSFVNHVIRDYVNKAKPKFKEQIQVIHLTLSQNKPKELDVLWLSVSSIADRFNQFLDSNPEKNIFKILEH